MTTLLAFAFVLGVLVFVHELGHFLAAKRIGIRVLKFQLGFNPTVISFRRGDTEYGIGALPLGGYVKMAGENPEDVERDEHGNVLRRPDEYMSKSKWERFQVLVMGPVMNLLLAFGLTAVVLYQGAQVPAYEDDPAIIGVVAPGSPAARADIQPGDRIVSVADRNVDTWEQFLIAIGTRPNREISVTLLRNGTESTRKVTPEVQPAQSRYEIGDIGVFPNVHPHIPSLVAGDPAEQGGVKAGDEIVAVDGELITFSTQLKDAIAKRPNQAITLTVLRGGAQQTVVVHTMKRGANGWIGISIQDAFQTVKPGAVQAVVLSAKKNVEYAS